MLNKKSSNVTGLPSLLIVVWEKKKEKTCVHFIFHFKKKVRNLSHTLRIIYLRHLLLRLVWWHHSEWVQQYPNQLESKPQLRYIIASSVYFHFLYWLAPANRNKEETIFDVMKGVNDNSLVKDQWTPKFLVMLLEN